MKHYDYKSDGSWSLIIALPILIIIIFTSCYRSCSVGTGELRTVRAIVTDKGIKRIHDHDTYLVYTDTQDGVEVFQITDSILAGRFNSADLYAEIKIGNTYDFGVRGDRNDVLSWYPNIYETVEVTK